MITCQHARQLYDRYLDGELSSPLQTELHAHRLRCSSCQSELAMLETCGDVIAMDRCEPTVSDDFTARVMAGLNGQSRPRRSHWTRTLVLTTAPLAAAASIVLAIFLTLPPAQPAPGTVTAGEALVAPKEVRDSITKLVGSSISDPVNQEMADLPEMETSNFVEALLSPVVQGTRDTWKNTRRGAEQLELLIQLGLGETSEKLVEQWRAQHQLSIPANEPATTPREMSEPADAPFNTSPSPGPADDYKFSEAL